MDKTWTLSWTKVGQKWDKGWTLTGQMMDTKGSQLTPTLSFWERVPPKEAGEGKRSWLSIITPSPLTRPEVVPMGEGEWNLSFSLWEKVSYFSQYAKIIEETTDEGSFSCDLF
jgi:hypothetical protein